MKDLIGPILALLFVALGACGVFFPQWCYRVVTPKQAARDKKRFRKFGIIVLVLGVGLLALQLPFESESPARHVIRECMAATDALEKSPPGVARVEGFIRRIRAIDTTGAPANLVQAMHEHIDALDRGTAALR